MTPLVKEFVSISPDAEKFMWFDVGNKPVEEVNFLVDPDKVVHLPFKWTAIVGVDGHRHKFALACVCGEESVTVTGMIHNGFTYDFIDPFCYMSTPEGIRLLPPSSGKPAPKNRDVMGIMAIISAFTDSLSVAVNGYQPTAKAHSMVNAKRIAKGKPPLIYDWRTVIIEPPKLKGNSQGGTHASPRSHDRRGHWRKHPSGKQVWVKNCVVGDASKGSVFKDYIVSV